MKKIFNKFIFSILIVLALSLIVFNFSSGSVKAKENPASKKQINVYFFWGQGCPHCASEKPFLEKLKNKYPQVQVHDYEVWKSKENRQLLSEVGQKLNTDVSGVPFTVVNEQYFVGWYNEEVTGAAIEKAVKCAIEKGCRDIVLEIQSQKEICQEPGECTREETKQTSIPEKISAPLLGKIETKNVSLPALSVILGALDGFNPCAMWTLIFLISLLLGMKNRKRMWILGSAFIIASAVVYFLFMAAWLNLILFIGIIFWVRILIGLVALGTGIYNLREFFTKKAATCKVTGEERRQKIFEKLKLFTQTQKFWLALGGIIVLAAIVNLVELVCSAGLPVVFTQILALSDLAKWQYYVYILIYIFFFMLDDLFVFFIAMITLKMTGVSTKYSHWAQLASGIIMLIIGLLLIFKPSWLMFG